MANLKLRSTTTATDPGSTSAKNSALTHAEMDSNFILLQADINSRVASASPTLTGTVQIDNNGILQFNEATANGSNYVQIKTPAAIASNYVLTLPPDDGSAGQVLTTDGSGVLTFTDKTALTSLDIDSFTDGTGITVAATDKLLIQDGTTEKKINASQLLDYVETGITMTGDLTSTAGATALGATTMSGQLNLAAQEITGDDTLTAPDLANASDITSVSQNGTMLRVNASDNDTSNTTQAGLFFDQGSGRMNFQLVQDLTGAHSGHSSVGGSGIIHPSLSFQTRDDGSGSTRATMDLMAPYQGGTGDTLTSSGSATGKICDVNTSKRIVYLQDVSGTWTVGHTTTGAPVAGIISGVVSIGTDAVAVQYQSSGFTTDFSSLTKATLGKVRISTKDVMNGRGQNSAPQLDIEGSQINMQNVHIDDADGLFVGGPDYADIGVFSRDATTHANYSLEVQSQSGNTGLVAGNPAGAFGMAAYADSGNTPGTSTFIYVGQINGVIGDGDSLTSATGADINNGVRALVYQNGISGTGGGFDVLNAATFRSTNTDFMQEKLKFSHASNAVTIESATTNDNLVLKTNGSTGYIILSNLPTSASGLPTGALYNDSGTLKIA